MLLAEIVLSGYSKANQQKIGKQILRKLFFLKLLDSNMGNRNELSFF